MADAAELQRLEGSISLTQFGTWLHKHYGNAETAPGKLVELMIQGQKNYSDKPTVAELHQKLQYDHNQFLTWNWCVLGARLRLH
jgi:hypothetical protein